MKSRADSLTTGWLLSEVIRRVSDDEDWYSDFLQSNRVITALESRREGDTILSTLDFYLTCYDKDLVPLSSQNTLRVVVSELRPEKADRPHIHKMEDFTVRRPIGVGGFSTVVEVRKKSSGKIYAMKMIKKEMIEKRDKIK